MGVGGGGGGEELKEEEDFYITIHSTKKGNGKLKDPKEFLGCMISEKLMKEISRKQFALHVLRTLWQIGVMQPSRS